MNENAQNEMPLTKELTEAKNFEQELIKTEKVTINGKTVTLIQLIPENVYHIEAMINIDSDYAHNADPDYEGSTANCMTKLAEWLNSENKDNEAYRKIIEDCVIAVDASNSTHLNSRRNIIGIEPRKRISDFIYNYGKVKLKESLEKSKYEFVDVLANAVRNEFPNANENRSFASKFCHYASFELFKGHPQQDNFSIYDRVIRDALPVYAWHYCKKRVTKEGVYYDDTQKCKNGNPKYKKQAFSYEGYSRVISDILEKIDNKNKISRNGFDHLLWYYHKGHPIWGEKKNGITQNDLEKEALHLSES